ncbi:hypothetical protein IC229_09000 [Spirosoma sp. BT702]|uniref:Uncharacterized protein n=1 Tax=Spirosoma profusum TaxID=2771354 RepID=A0A926XZK7_9BACT|nr:hypothetical protein [Spirosoma profusum]MBD2700773.1 hypothetical protein [Spirosoma profusum]
MKGIGFIDENPEPEPPLDTRLKYQHLIDAHNLASPCPNECSPVNMVAYRFVKSENITLDDFLPTEIEDKQKPGYNRKIKNQAALCHNCAISLYDNAEKAIYKLNYLSDRFAHAFAGRLIAIGMIDETDGLASKSDESGHFSFYEYINSEIYTNFAVFTYAA